MSMASLEGAILAAAKIAFKNSKLRMKDIREWSTGNVKIREDEVSLRLDTGESVAILKINDKRK